MNDQNANKALTSEGPTIVACVINEISAQIGQLYNAKNKILLSLDRFEEPQPVDRPSAPDVEPKTTREAFEQIINHLQSLRIAYEQIAERTNRIL